MTRTTRTLIMTVAGLVTVATPAVWLLGGPEAGQFVGAAVQGAAGVGALLWALLQRPSTATGQADSASATGDAETTGGGSASTGVRRPGGAGTGSATAHRTGKATAKGRRSRANTGIDYS